MSDKAAYHITFATLLELEGTGFHVLHTNSAVLFCLLREML